MSTVSKALDLLNWFSADRAQIGLAEFQRLTGRDKATTYRYLCALEETGFIEKDPATRTYKIGPAVLRLAHVREVTVPRRAGVRLVLPQLAEATGELAHVSILQGHNLVPLTDHASSRHSARVVINESVLPLHATGSGLAVLAFGDTSLRTASVKTLKRYTSKTPTSTAELDTQIKEVERTGFAIVDQSYEDGVFGVGVPLFDSTNRVVGAVAVASVASRMRPDNKTVIKCELVMAARQITRNWGGEVPESLDQLWTNFINSHSPIPRLFE